MATDFELIRIGPNPVRVMDHRGGQPKHPVGDGVEYRLAPGPATTRNAIALLKLKGASEAFVARALARAGTLERQRELSR